MKWPTWGKGKPATRVGASMRGRVFASRNVATGELSVTIRFGREEHDAAQRLLAGRGVEVFELAEPEKQPASYTTRMPPG